MADPLPVSSTIMPDAHRRGTPDVTRPVLDDVADCEAAESLDMGELLNPIGAATPDEQTLHCAYQHIALQCLTKALATLAIQNRVPTERLETIVSRIVAADSIGGGYPDAAIVVSGHRHDPVVT